ncbi:hypothetical protein ACYOEI_02485 [Singulisphaera rosea]
MKAKIFVTSSGYDPDKGKHVKDPYLGPCPTLGACRPDIREKLQKGDQIFTVSGKVPGVPQLVMGGFEIAEKIPAIEAYERFPDLRLRKREDGQLTGNVIVNAEGKQHVLDGHNKFDRRIQNYIIGTNPIVLSTPTEIAEGRRLTLEILQDVFGKKGDSVRSIIGRCSNMNEKQVEKLRRLLEALKDNVRQPRPVAVLRGLSEVARMVG